MRALLESPWIDAGLIRLFRLRTRGFLRLAETTGAPPPPPRAGGCHLYVHVPFCAALCPFCSFHRVPHQAAAAARYFTALRRELLMYHDAGYAFAGAYFGGGTPTIEPEELQRTIELVRTLFPVREISVESHPRDLAPARLAALRAAGVTRLSVGVQSFDDELLREMGRLESYGSGAGAAERIRAAAGVFPVLNVDLIFNLPHQTPASLARDLAIFRSLGASQVSCYPLMTSPAAERRMAATMGLPDRSRLHAAYRTIVRTLTPDFSPTSAWCFTRSGSTGDEYLVSAENYVGVGSGAFSYLDGTLHASTFSLAHYEQRIAAGLTGITTRHTLSTGDRMRYTLLVQLFGLRLDRAAVQRRHGPRFFRRLWGELATLLVLGAARRDGSGWQLTERGMYWLMLMMAEFFRSVNCYREAMRAHVSAEQPAASALPMVSRRTVFPP